MRRLLVAQLLSLLLIISITGCAQTANEAQDYPIDIKIGHTDSSSRSTHKWAVWLGEYLEEKAPSKFNVEVYSDGQLGDSPDLVAVIKLGTVQMMFDLSAVVTAATGDASTLIDLPYLYPSYEAWVEGTFNKGGLELFNETIKESGYYAIDMYYNGMRQLISSSRNYHNSDDLRGQKVRISQNDLNVEVWKAMGANPTPMAWGEVITSLSQNTINALDHSLGVFNDFSLHEIAPYVTLTNHASSPFPIMTSLDWIESLDPADRAVLEEGVKEMARQQRDEERAKESEYIERFKNEGATVEELTPEEVDAFIEAVQPVYEMWRQKVGDEIMDKWLQTRP